MAPECRPEETKPVGTDAEEADGFDLNSQRSVVEAQRGILERGHMGLMTLMLKQCIERPLAAFVVSVEILGQGLQGDQTIDAIASRIVHTLSSPPGRRSDREEVATNSVPDARREGSGSCKTC
jgi:hypothetical protein